MPDRVTERCTDLSASLRRQSHALPFVGVGTVCIVAGGVVAAVTAHSPTESGTWAVAYLVLVAGVAQIALGAGQALLAARTPPRYLVIAEAVLWNCANTGVLAGTLLGVEAIIDVGGGLLVVVLALFVHGARGAGGHARWLRSAYWLLVVALLVSIPIGLLLARGGEMAAGPCCP